MPGFVLSFTWTAVHAILAALTLFGGAAFWVGYKAHLRFRNLEENSGERRTAIFGNENNPLHVGLTKEVSVLKERVDELRDDSVDAADERAELQKRLARVEAKLDQLLDESDD